MMDNLTRWSIGLGAGILISLGGLSAYIAATAEVQNRSFGYALDQVTPDFASLDVVIEYDSFSLEDFSAFAEVLQNTAPQPERLVGCGGYGNPAHVCTIDATLPGALHLTNANADVIRDKYALTIGEYRSEYEEALLTADSVLVDTGEGLRPVTYEGNGTFTLGFLGEQSLGRDFEPWQFAAAAVPAGAVWLAAAAIAAAGTVLVAAAFRPRREDAIEEVGIEVFDELVRD